MGTDKKAPITIKAKPEDWELMDVLRSGRFSSRAEYLHYLLLMDEKQLKEKGRDTGPKGILSDEELEVRLAKSGYLSEKEADGMRKRLGVRVRNRKEEADEKGNEKPPDRGAAV